jgi:Domain of unknown function (DUF4405)
MKFSREWATPLTAGSFIVLAVTGLLMFFHFDRGLNHLAHEWIGWLLVLGVTCHVTANYLGFKKHLSGHLGKSVIFVFILVLGLSFIQPEERKRPPGWAQPVKALAFLPFNELASVAKLSVDEVRERLTESGLNPTSNDQSIKDLVGHNLRKQVAALNAIFPEESED